MNSLDRTLASLIIVVVALGLGRELESPPQSRESRILVEVAGEVVSPRIVSLPEGARVAHALVLCGGLTNRAQTSQLSLAAPLRDGQKILVPGPAPVVAPVPRPVVDRRLDLNTATRAELVALKGIGKKTADRILKARRERGGCFASLEDLGAIRGIKGKTLSRLRPHIKIEGL